MVEWYIKQMYLAHEEGRYEDRNNYARAAGVDVIEEFYMKKDEKNED